jgi:hypothetical protein
LWLERKQESETHISKSGKLGGTIFKESVVLTIVFVLLAFLSGEAFGGLAAAKRGDVVTVRAMLAHGAAVNQADKSMATLHLVWPPPVVMSPWRRFSPNQHLY